MQIKGGKERDEEGGREGSQCARRIGEKGHASLPQTKHGFRFAITVKPILRVTLI